MVLHVGKQRFLSCDKEIVILKVTSVIKVNASSTLYFSSLAFISPERETSRLILGKVDSIK